MSGPRGRPSGRSSRLRSRAKARRESRAAAAAAAVGGGRTSGGEWNGTGREGEGRPGGAAGPHGKGVSHAWEVVRLQALLHYEGMDAVSRPLTIRMPDMSSRPTRIPQNKPSHSLHVMRAWLSAAREGADQMFVQRTSIMDSVLEL